MVKDSEASRQLMPSLLELLDNEQKQNELKENIVKQAITHADDDIAREIIKRIG